MNEQQFLEMAERDKWIDEFIMGKTRGVCVKPDIDEAPYGGCQCMTCGWQGNWDSTGSVYAHNEPIPDYTDANAMMRVLDMVSERHGDYCIETYSEKRCVNIVLYDTSGYAEHEDLKTAVYLAAGRAIGVIE